MKAFTWVEPSSVDAAIAAGARPGALFKAGGIDVADRLKEHLDEPESLVNLRKLKDLDFLREVDGALRIGPLVTLARLAADDRVLKRTPALAQAAAAAATPQVREMATLGGNLAQRPRCWYFRNELFPCRRKGGVSCFALDGEHENHAIFDNEHCAVVHASGTATALVALGARVTLKGPKGRRELPLDEFFVSPTVDITRENVLAPGELITEIRVPTDGTSAYVKLMQKQSFDWPMADAAAWLDVKGGRIERARVVIGAVAPTPHRAPDAEAALMGKPFDANTVAAAARAVTKGATPLKNNGHKVALAQVAARRALASAGGLT